MNRPVSFSALLKFFSITWIVLAALLGFVLQTRFNDLTHIQASIDRVEKMVLWHLERDIPSTLLNKQQ
jgi:hypothetical protein